MNNNKLIDFYKINREELPSTIKLYDNNTLSELTWIENNNYHRNEKPANISFWNNGNIKILTWWKYGLLHRWNGPAYIKYNENGNIEKIKWYIEHKEITNPPFDYWPLTKNEQIELKLLFA